jgi:hypothetical protein
MPRLPALEGKRRFQTDSDSEAAKCRGRSETLKFHPSGFSALIIRECWLSLAECASRRSSVCHSDEHTRGGDLTVGRGEGALI